MADIVNIYNRHVYQHNRKKNAKIEHRNPRHLKITVIFGNTKQMDILNISPAKPYDESISVRGLWL